MIFAYYLPQFHQIPENDKWWGKGFTEWTNVKKASPFYLGHRQPIIPGELGYYDLKTSDALKRQAKLAKDHGVEGFVFYHYWFGEGKTLLEKPILNFLNDPSINIKFCICWANESWRGTWHGASNNLLLQEQRYLGEVDYIKHFEFLLPFFLDPRCLQIDSKPVYQIYAPESIPDLGLYIATFNKLSKSVGLKGIYWMVVKHSDRFDPNKYGIQGIINNGLRNINQYHHKSLKGVYSRYFLSNPFIRKFMRWPKRIPFEIIRKCLEDFKTNYSYDFFPLAIPNWDNTPRVKHEGTVYTHCSPEEFKFHMEACIIQSKKNKGLNKDIVFIKSWNEWAEGNILEPSLEYGRGYLEALRSVADG